MRMYQKLRFGIKTAPQYIGYQDILRVWLEADRVPVIEHAWLFDHFMPIGSDPTGPCLEGWTLLAALAAQTQRLRVGVMVTGNTYRHPAILANMAATVDIISHGRLDFGIGAGWYEVEHSAFGIPLYSAGERIRRLDEACEVIHCLWTNTVCDFDGQYYKLKGAYCEPKPIQKPYPRFFIGGAGEKLTLRVAAKHADVWNFGGSIEDFLHKSAVLVEHCATIGRDPNSIERSIQVFVHPTDLSITRNRLRNFIEVGATHLILHLRPPYPNEIVHRLADEVVGPLLAEYS